VLAPLQAPSSRRCNDRARRGRRVTAVPDPNPRREAGRHCRRPRRGQAAPDARPRGPASTDSGATAPRRPPAPARSRRRRG
jgi:hypothetical protein